MTLNKSSGNILKIKKCKYCNKEFHIKDFPKCFNRMITCGVLECKKKYKKEWTFSKNCSDCGKPISYLANKCKACSSLGENNPFYGKTHSQESLKKIKLFKKGEPSKRKGKLLLNISKIKISVTKRKITINEWEDFAVSLNKRLRHSISYITWRESVFKRDNYTCQECRINSGKGKSIFLEAHHIKPFSLFPELRFDISNGITYCSDCHSIKDKDRRKFIPLIVKQETLLCP